MPLPRESAREALLADLYGRSGAAPYGLERAAFDRILEEIGRKYLPSDAGLEKVRQFYSGLRLEELALARACAAGNERAWEVFLTRYREKLYGAAHGITREDTAARELADSLYADLYGTQVRDGRRVSKLESYTGRGSLEGWLRTVLAQEFVNRYRRGKRLVSLEEEAEAGHQFAAPAADTPAPVDPRLPAATDRALASLTAEERYILAAYHLDGRTLAEIARTLGVHESTISRKLEKVAAAVRKRILEALEAEGMSHRQAEEALEADVRDLGLDLRRRLAQETPGGSFSGKGAGSD